MTRLYAGSALALVAAMLGTTAWIAYTRSGGDDPFATCRSAQIAGGTAAIGGPFELIDTTGATVTDADVITEPALIYFGYTFCPDVCPFDAARNADAVDIMAERGIAARPVFISVDPARDTPEVLADFAGAMHPKMVGLTGSAEQVEAASKAYRTYYRKQESGDEFYLVDHSTFTYLVLPGHGFVEFFRRETTAEDMAETAACFVEAAG